MNVVRVDVIARADLTAHVRIPLVDVPLQALGSDGCRTPDRNEPHVCSENPTGLQRPDGVTFAPQDERKTGFRE